MIGFRKIKKLLFFASGGVFLLLMLGVLLSFVFEDEIKNFAIEKIGENVTTEINVDEVSFSLLKKFPSASLQFKNVLVKETFQTKDTLLFAKNVFLEFDVFDLVTKKYQVKSVSIDEAVAKIKWYENKEDNFHFWKSSASNESSDFAFSINKIILDDSFLEIDYRPSNFYMAAHVDQIDASGNFNEKNTAIVSTIDLVMNKLQKDEVIYSDHYQLEGKIQSDIAQNGSVTIKNTSVNVDQIPLDIQGKIVNDKTINMDLSIVSTAIDIAKLIKHLPKEAQTVFSNYRTEGKGKMTCIIQGESSATSNPDVFIDYEITDGSFKHLASGTRIDQVHALGKFTLLNHKPEKLSLNQLKASFEGNQFNLNGWIENFASPKFDFSTKGHFSLEDIKDFASINSLKELTGIIDLNTRFQGTLSSFSDIQANELKKVNIKGAANIHETNVALQDSPRRFENVEARLVFNNQNTKIQFINGEVENSDFHLNGTLDNILPYLFFDNENLNITANFSSSTLDFNRLITEKTSTSGDEEYRFIFPDDINFTLKAKVDHFEFRKFTADNLTGTARLKNKTFTVDPIHFATAEGNCDGKLTAKADAKDNIHLLCNLEVKAIDINNLFYEFENFGQDLIVQDNIKGNATATIQFSSFLNSALEFDEDNISSTIDITIKNGELIELDAMSEISEYIASNRILSKLVNEQELDGKLRHINFSKLSNTIIIADKQVRIPSMDIYSSAMDITVAGTHSFNNNLDYTLGFKIRDVLSNNNESEFGEIEDDGLSNSFFLSMKGQPDHLSFGYDNIAHRQKRKEDRQKEKETFKNLIKNEVQGNNTSTSNNDKTATKVIVEDNNSTTQKKKKWFEKGKDEDHQKKSEEKPDDGENEDDF